MTLYADSSALVKLITLDTSSIEGFGRSAADPNTDVGHAPR
jgi:hypothetical protein